MLSSALFITPAAAVSSLDVTGVWYDSMKEGAIEVVPCGKKFCGHIIWTKQKESSRGGAMVDINNPVEQMRKRPICGLKVLRDLQPLTDGTVGRGVVYDPKKGQENEASLKRLGEDQLQLTGYGLFGLARVSCGRKRRQDLSAATVRPVNRQTRDRLQQSPAPAATAPAAAAAGAAVAAKPKPAPAPKPAEANATPSLKPAQPTQKPPQKPASHHCNKPQSAAPSTTARLRALPP